MKITNNKHNVLYKQLKHNEHFKFRNQEYVKIDNRITNEIIRCALRPSDGYLAEFSSDQWVEKVGADALAITLQSVNRGQVFRYSDNYYLRVPELDIDKMITVFNLTTCEIIKLNRTTLVNVMEAELILNEVLYDENCFA